MKIACVLCEQEFVVDGKLEDGQHVLCPYCGGKSEYRKVTRIELPKDLGSINRTGEQGDAESEKTEEFEEIKIAPPEVAPSVFRKPLHVIRKNNEKTEGGAATERQMVSRRLHMAEDHVRFYEEMKDIEHRRKMREMINSILLLLVVAICALVAYWYVGYRKEQRQQAELAFAEERNRLEAEHAENERREKERRDAEEKARQERILAEKRKNEEQMRIAQAEKEKEANALHESMVLYRQVRALFAGGEFDFIKALPEDSRPGKVISEFYYLLPFLNNEEIVVCNSSTNGIESVCRLDESGRRTALDADTFLSSLEGKDYLVAYNEKVYFQSKRKKPRIVQISKTEVVDIVKVFFGDIAKEVKSFDLDPDRLRFEIVFVPSGGKNIVVVDTIEYGAQYSLSKVMEAIEDAFPMKSGSYSSASRSRYKRTVVFWEGAHIKKGIDGVTYVPRSAPPMTIDSTMFQGPRIRGTRLNSVWVNRIRRLDNTREHWSSLAEEARRQEEAEKRFYEQQELARRKRDQSAMSKAEREYAAKIDGIYKSGALYIRAKIDKR